MAARSKEISVFVDESGSFDSSPIPSRYYIVCLVFHDQDISISSDVAELGRHLVELGLPENHCVHAGPLVRREQEYAFMSREERRLIFTRMLAFIRRLNIAYRCFVVDKKFVTTTESIRADLSRQLSLFLLRNRSVFDLYERLKVYYDNGQGQIKALLKEAFAPFSSKTDFIPEVTPEKYRLFQVADMLCTLELTRVKLEVERRISESEKKFFVSIQNLKRRYLRQVAAKCWQWYDKPGLLADLYDPLTMPPKLRKAHAANNAAVMKTYGFPPDLIEPEIVSRLFEMYAALTKAWRLPGAV